MYHDTDVTIYDVYHDTKPISNESGPILSIVICCVSVHFHIYFSKIVKEITFTKHKDNCFSQRFVPIQLWLRMSEIFCPISGLKYIIKS